ncbi:MAG: hypothetical protein U0Q15_06580 [Kineosporiaceae bacterium]
MSDQGESRPAARPTRRGPRRRRRTPWRLRLRMRWRRSRWRRQPATERRADELSLLINGHPEHVSGALPELATLLADSPDAATTSAVVAALGHAWDDRALRILLDADLAGHPDPYVRLDLARALNGGMPAPDLRRRAIPQLVLLSGDRVDEVRDWACCGLAALLADDPTSREALAARLEDPHADTRAEALVALALAGDPRALPRTIALLSVEDDGDVTLLQLEAAVQLADPALLPALTALERAWAQDEYDEHVLRLRRALRRCTPEAAALAADVERRLVAGLDERLAPVGHAVELRGSYPRTTLHVSDEEPEAGWWRRLWEHDDPDTLDVSQAVESWFLSTR